MADDVDDDPELDDFSDYDEEYEKYEEYDRRTRPYYDNPRRRRIWEKLELLLSQAQRVLDNDSHAEGSADGGLLNVLSYLAELETAVTRELDYAVIALREHHKFGWDHISVAFNTPWEHDYSHKMIPMPDPDELMDRMTNRQARGRYVSALRRQFGITGVHVPGGDWPDRFEDERHERFNVINETSDENQLRLSEDDAKRYNWDRMLAPDYVSRKYDWYDQAWIELRYYVDEGNEHTFTKAEVDAWNATLEKYKERYKSRKRRLRGSQ